MGRRSGIARLAAFALTLGLAPSASRGHCDGLDGPVVSAARRALEAGDVRLVLAWVPERDETELRRVFDQTRRVRALPEARELADTHFFETLVRLHRAAEGAPYTGLAPAGRDLGPAIPAADRALESGDVEPLLRLLHEELEHGVRAHYTRARSARAAPEADVAARRAFVASYVAFVHQVEALHEAATRTASGHYPEAEPVNHPHE
jgi:hypothetical protein